MATTPKATTKDLIAAPAIFRATDKNGAFLGYGVPSDSQPGVTYQVTWNETAKIWACNCPATKPCKHIKAVCEVCRERKALGKTQFCPCDTAKAAVAATVATKPVTPRRQQEPYLLDEECAALKASSNEIAAIFVSAAHTQQPATTAQGEGDAQRAQFQQAMAERERRETAPLNGNRGFSMLRR